MWAFQFCSGPNPTRNSTPEEIRMVYRMETGLDNLNVKGEETFARPETFFRRDLTLS